MSASSDLRSCTLTKYRSLLDVKQLKMLSPEDALSYVSWAVHLMKGIIHKVQSRTKVQGIDPWRLKQAIL